MSVRRDPETGQFISAGESVTWSDVTTVRGHKHYEVPAADLSGGTTSGAGGLQVDGSASQILDFTGVLDNDEVFEVYMAKFAAVLVGHTTATAESHMHAAGGVTPDGNLNAGARQVSPTFWRGLESEVDLVDITDGEGVTDSLWEFVIDAEPSFGDSTNGLGAGSETGQDIAIVPFKNVFGNGPVYDRDDELFAPVEMHVDNASDHAIRTTVMAQLYGVVHQLD